MAVVLSPLARQIAQHDDLERAILAWPLAGIVAIADTATLVADLQLAMRTRVIWRPHIVFGEAPRPASITDAIIGGATDYLAWPIKTDELANRLEMWRSRSTTIARKETNMRRARSLLAKLSPREAQVLNRIAEGCTSAQVAAALGIAVKTVEIHRANLVRKLGVGGMIMAARLVLEATD